MRRWTQQPCQTCTLSLGRVSQNAQAHARASARRDVNELNRMIGSDADEAPMLVPKASGAGLCPKVESGRGGHNITWHDVHLAWLTGCLYNVDHHDQPVHGDSRRSDVRTDALAARRRGASSHRAVMCPAQNINKIVIRV